MLLRRKTLFLLAGIWFLATLFNITKAVYIDDISTFNTGNYLLENPLSFYQAVLKNVADTGIPLERSVTHPPFLFYLSSLLIFIFGRSEIVFHTVWSLFTLISLVFFYKLAERLTGKGILLSFFFIAGPAFIPSQNLMLDTPLVAFILAFFYFLLFYSDMLKGLIMAGISCSLAFMTKYSGLILLPVFALSFILKRKYRHFWTVFIPVSVLIIWSLYNYFDFGRIHILSANASGYALTIWEKWLLWTIVLGAVSPLTVSLIAALVSRKKERWLIPLTLLIALVFSVKFLTFPGEKNSLWLLRTVFFANGLLLTITSIRIIFGISYDYFIKKADGQYKLMQVAVWYILLTVITIIFVPFMAVRYLLPVLPALLLLLGAKGYFSSSRTVIIFTVLLTLGLTLNIAYSDNLQADVYRRGALQIREAINQPSRESSYRVWSAGFYGWRFYSEKNGLRPYDGQKDDLQNGDFLATTTFYPPNISLFHQNFLTFESEIIVPRTNLSLVSTMTNWPHNGEGFYYLPSTRSLPYIFNPDFPMEKFTVYRINR